MVLAFLALILHAGTSAGTPLPSREIAAAPAPRLRVLVRIDPRGAGKSFRLPDVVDQVREIWRPYIDIDFADVGTGIALTASGMRGYDDELTLLIIDRLPVQNDLPAQGSSGSSNEAALDALVFSDAARRLGGVLDSVGRVWGQTGRQIQSVAHEMKIGAFRLLRKVPVRLQNGNWRNSREDAETRRR